MSIREIQLKDTHYQPGETLSQLGGQFTHVTISYDITGDRSKIDRLVSEAVENSNYLSKVECVNTTLYWQSVLGLESDSQGQMISRIKGELKDLLQSVFVNTSDRSNETVTAFCMVGNIRAFAFELDA
ncbi:hypothetical protein [Pseudomonas aegrilactucae]|uniref:Uncharacterized protein n=1 Tax=Pseudomonas aegrilactucae TaxID=2854028 RepID=A0A9Q3AFC6_9PSED|nr:hypothetical protein [Pseudomonas aegrilactucae]MBV6289560.1 hypothetical protein [Pseudomonas aegrilactucae]